jgi:hypothetical protein
MYPGAVPDPANWVLSAACEIDLAGGQCIGDDEILTHHAQVKGEYNNGPRPEIKGEDEVSVHRGAISLTEACIRRNRRNPVAPQDIARAGIRRARAGDLRAADFAVIHTPGPKSTEPKGHVSVIWPPGDPLNQREALWPPHVQEAFRACFTEVEG